MVRIGFQPESRLVYALPEAKRGLAQGQPRAFGDVAAFLCDSCGLIRLYGEPKSKS